MFVRDRLREVRRVVEGKRWQSIEMKSGSVQEILKREDLVYMIV
jgi:hypothetical protein